MAIGISLEGIDEAISNLNYQNPDALKFKLVYAIRGSYGDEGSLESVRAIDAEDIVKALWDAGGDSDVIKAKRKNLSNTKSSVNTDLKKLFKEGKNREGIIIGRDNVFVMSDEAKDEILSTFEASVADGEPVNLKSISEVLSTIKDILSDTERISGADSPEGPDKWKDLKAIIQGLAEKFGIDEQGPSLDEDEADLEEAVEDAELFEEVLDEEDADLEEKDEDDMEEVFEEVEVDDDLEEDLVEDEAQFDDTEVEEVEGVDEDEFEEVFEEVEVDEELIEEDDFEEVEVVDDAEDVGLPIDNLGEGLPADGEDETDNAKLLAETFDGYLGAMERYYNQYIIIPEDEYVVGSKAPKRNERSEQKVRLPAFYMGKYPVTNALFEVFVEKTGYKTMAENRGFSTVYYGRVLERVDERTGLVKLIWNATVRSETIHGACWYQPFGPGSTLYNKRNHPVVHVSLEDAMAFGAWTGKRLPTETEWEAAARTANGHEFPWGEEWKSNACTVEESAVGDTTSVDKYTEFQNDLGITDTLGNVLEWTLDTYESPHNAKSIAEYKILKGGSWISPNDIRVFSRFKMEPSASSNIVGFRCVAY